MSDLTTIELDGKTLAVTEINEVHHHHFPYPTAYYTITAHSIPQKHSKDELMEMIEANERQHQKDMETIRDYINNL